MTSAKLMWGSFHLCKCKVTSIAACLVLTINRDKDITLSELEFVTENAKNTKIWAQTDTHTNFINNMVLVQPAAFEIYKPLQNPESQKALFITCIPMKSD